MHNKSGFRAILTTLSLAGVLSVAAFTLGCSTTTYETDPSKVSAADLRENTRLQGYLAERRETLTLLQSNVSELELRLNEKHQKLSTLRNELLVAQRQSQSVNQQLAAISQRVERQQKQLLEKQTQLKTLRTQVENLHQEKMEKSALRTKIALYEVEIEDLQNEVAVIERSIDKTLVIRARHALENS